MKCEICEQESLAIVVHHLSYYPEQILSICANCHALIHNPPDSSDYNKIHPNLVRFIQLNKTRVEESTYDKNELEIKDINLELQKERLQFQKLINENWRLRNLILTRRTGPKRYPSAFKFGTSLKDE
jgi:hypothetical protein